MCHARRNNLPIRGYCDIIEANTSNVRRYSELVDLFTSYGVEDQDQPVLTAGSDPLPLGAERDVLQFKILRQWNRQGLPYFKGKRRRDFALVWFFLPR